MLRFSRREVALGGFAILTNFFGTEATAQSFKDDPFPPLPTDLERYAEDPDFFSSTLEFDALGTAEPSDLEKKIAREIMQNAPFNTRPIEVARYYRDIGQGLYGDGLRPYARGWPVKYNPVIIELFKVTNINPLAPNGQGDATPWCAAFVNYCIARAMSRNGAIGEKELAFGTTSASSGSFRCWPDHGSGSAEPQEGDVVVWALQGTVNGCAYGKGHVGFFVHLSGNPAKPYVVLGGNQSGDPMAGNATRKDAIVQKAMPIRYPTDSGYKEVLSFRRANFL